MRRQLVDGVTVLGNLAIDVINGAPKSPGGCASFAGVALEAAGRHPVGSWPWAPSEDHALFDPLLERFGRLVRILPADRTSAFRLDYDDVDHRHMSVDAIGPVWGAAEVEAADPDTTWVHLAPLLRTDFPAETLALLAAARPSRRLRRAGPGARRPRWAHWWWTATSRPTCSPTSASSSWPRTRRSSSPTARSTQRRPSGSGVPEILVTYGSEGCDIYTEGDGRPRSRRVARRAVCRPRAPATCSPLLRGQPRGGRRSAAGRRSGQRTGRPRAREAASRRVGPPGVAAVRGCC